MNNEEIFDHINDGNYRPVLKYFHSFSESFYFFCRKQDKLKHLDKHQIQAVFDDACICLYEKIEAKVITYHQMSASVKTLIFAIGKNMVLEQSREQFKYNSLHSSLENDFRDVENIRYEDNDYQLTELDISQLNEALSNLPIRDYRLIMEGFMEGKSYSEIAKEQNYPSSNAVAVAIHRTLKLLKKEVIELRKRDGNY